MDAEAAVSLSGDLGLWLNGGNPVLHWEREDAGDALEAFVRKLDEAGRPAEMPIVEPWKCPYHNGRMALEVMRRID